MSIRNLTQSIRRAGGPTNQSLAEALEKLDKKASEVETVATTAAKAASEVQSVVYGPPPPLTGVSVIAFSEANGTMRYDKDNQREYKYRIRTVSDFTSRDLYGFIAQSRRSTVSFADAATKPWEFIFSAKLDEVKLINAAVPSAVESDFGNVGDDDWWKPFGVVMYVQFRVGSVNPDGDVAWSDTIPDVTVPAGDQVDASTINPATLHSSLTVAQQKLTLADNAVTQQKLADLAVATAKMQDLAATFDKLALFSVGGFKIQTGGVDNQYHLVDGILARSALFGTAVINDAAINTLNANKITAGEISGSTLFLNLNGVVAEIRNAYDANYGYYAGLTVKGSASNQRTMVTNGGLACISTTGMIAWEATSFGGFGAMSLRDPSGVQVFAVDANTGVREIFMRNSVSLNKTFRVVSSSNTAIVTASEVDFVNTSMASRANLRGTAGAGGQLDIYNSSGSIVVQITGSGFVLAQEYRDTNNNKVLGTRQSAISAPSGGTTIDTEARAAIGSMLTAMRNHGFIAT